MHEHIDCKDSCNKWLDAVIIDIKQQIDRDNNNECIVDIKVAYTGFAREYDEWIVSKEIADRVLKQWGSPDENAELNFDDLQVNNRIDVLDVSKNRWREARVIEIFRHQRASEADTDPLIQAVKVHYKGLHSKFDEVIEQQDFHNRISPIQRLKSKKKQSKKVK